MTQLTRLTEKLLNRDSDDEFGGKLSSTSFERTGAYSFTVPVERIHADEENLLQVVPPNSQEAIVSCLSLHWVNDLPGMYTLTYCMLLRYDYEEQEFLYK